MALLSPGRKVCRAPKGSAVPCLPGPGNKGGFSGRGPCEKVLQAKGSGKSVGIEYSHDSIDPIRDKPGIIKFGYGW